MDAGTHGLDAFGVKGADHVGRHADGVTLDLGDARPRVRADVGLVEDHRWQGAARPDAGEVALDAAHVEVGVEATHGEHQVDVGRDHLRPRLAAGGAPREHRAPLEDALDDDGAAWPGGFVDEHPVADTGRPGLRALDAEPSRDLGASRAGRRPHLVRAPMFGRDARGGEPVVAGCPNLSLEEGAEAQRR